MRIATITFQQNATTQMQNLQSDLAKTQNDIATATRLHSAADDPAAMSQVNQLNVQMSASQQFVTNGNYATSTLQLEEQAMADATNVLQGARDLAVQANNSALSASERANIAAELTQQLQNLVAIGNRVDGSGNQLFAGNASGTVPFSQSGNTVTYSGSNQVSQIQIAANQRISAGDTGATVFMNIPAGNGTFTTSGAATNTGTGSIGVGTVSSPAAWVPDTYTIAFTTPTDYTVTNSAGTVVTTGNAFKDGDSIAFNGVQIPITGTPAAGDTFTVAKAGTASAFSTLSNLITTLSDPTLSSAQISSQIGGSLQQIDNAISNMSNVSASVGARLNSITSSQGAAQTLQTNLTAAVSQLSDTDYAAAITKLNTEEVSLQAAQQSYASISKLSLFNYLR
ncbi:MAG: flagellar hook-associated protein 3 FlgL [Gammaproteobacteria bacterium]|nr:flagellar hook-associated protein 3 FlgL [Gammaproteobacteria bacterium]